MELEYTTPGLVPTLETRARPLNRLFRLFALWRQNIRTRRQLAELDERLLSDVGISPSERIAEISRPFWR
ncbi:hypothetical protein D3C76_826020 [compost metagenome]|uniref:Uncharacterized conserved protein YjiS, DUF1127 family n=1 Tax=Pseudomonas jinjuensis TaxID=198616 RepID=A0A1H0C4M5_9PSED|nr:DUF1127 domain-containing protein [Pseudomonas jinjuensis]SDN52803.1 Uncharacterized conserved protein YjiS, DUF1127 family [Pseudomonas jinjuensis]